VRSLTRARESASHFLHTCFHHTGTPRDNECSSCFRHTTARLVQRSAKGRLRKHGRHYFQTRHRQVRNLHNLLVSECDLEADDCSQLNVPDLSDLKIRCADREWLVHKLVLCTQSTYFDRAVKSGMKVSQVKSRLSSVQAIKPR